MSNNDCVEDEYNWLDPGLFFKGLSYGKVMPFKGSLKGSFWKDPGMCFS